MRTRVGAWALLCAGVGCTDPDPMNAQARYEPFEHSAFFNDGRAMRPLVPGTVPREWRARRVPGGETGLLPDGGWVERLPVPLTPSLLDEGRSRYDAFCAVCHGLDGSGESVVARNMPSRRPPSLVAPHSHAVEVVYGAAEAQRPYGAVRSGEDGGGHPHPVPLPAGEGGLAADHPAVRAARAIAGDGEGGVSLAGRSGGGSAPGELPHPLGYYFTVMSEGYGIMPSYAQELTPRERWAVVAWLRVLARSQRAPLAAAPPEVRQRLLQQAPGEGSP